MRTSLDTFNQEWTGSATCVSRFSDARTVLGWCPILKQGVDSNAQYTAKSCAEHACVFRGY